MPLQLIRNRQTKTLTWGASQIVSQDIQASGAITRVVLRVRLTPSGSYVSNHAVDGLWRIIQTLNLMGSGGVGYFSMGDVQIGRMLHLLNRWDGIVKGTGHEALGTPVDIVFVMHFGSRPYDQYGRPNPFDLSAFIPAFADSDLRLDWGTTANNVTDAAITISSAIGYLTIYEVMGTAQDIKTEMARQGVAQAMIPISSYKSYPHSADYSDLSSEHDVPTGAFLRRVALLVVDESSPTLRANDEVAQVGLKLPVGNQRVFQDDFRAMMHSDGGDLDDLAEIDVGVTTGVLRTSGGFVVMDLRQHGFADYGLDLRHLKGGDVKLGLTIENYTSGDRTFIWWDQVRPYSF